MGYNMTQYYAEFFISAKNKEPALEAMKNLVQGVKDFHNDGKMVEKRAEVSWN